MLNLPVHKVKLGHFCMLCSETEALLCFLLSTLTFILLLAKLLSYYKVKLTHLVQN